MEYAVHMDGLNAFVNQYKGKVLRLWKYKKMFTPYEQAKKFCDESVYEDDISDTVKVVEAYWIGNRALIGYVPVYDKETLDMPVEDAPRKFAFLDEVVLEYYPDDAAEIEKA